MHEMQRLECSRFLCSYKDNFPASNIMLVDQGLVTVEGHLNIETAYPRAAHQRCWVHKMRSTFHGIVVALADLLRRSTRRMT